MSKKKSASDKRFDEAMLTVASLTYQRDTAQTHLKLSRESSQKEIERLTQLLGSVQGECNRLTAESEKMRSQLSYLGYTINKSIGDLYERERTKHVRALAQQKTIEEVSRLVTSISTTYKIASLCRLTVDDVIAAFHKREQATWAIAK